MVQGLADVAAGPKRLDGVQTGVGRLPWHRSARCESFDDPGESVEGETRPRLRHTPEQVVRNLREADGLLSKGMELPVVIKRFVAAEAAYHWPAVVRRWRHHYPAGTNNHPALTAGGPMSGVRSVARVVEATSLARYPQARRDSQVLPYSCE